MAAAHQTAGEHRRTVGRGQRPAERLTRAQVLTEQLPPGSAQGLMMPVRATGWRWPARRHRARLAWKCCAARPLPYGVARQIAPDRPVASDSEWRSAPGAGPGRGRSCRWYPRCSHYRHHHYLRQRRLAPCAPGAHASGAPVAPFRQAIQRRIPLPGLALPERGSPPADTGRAATQLPPPSRPSAATRPALPAASRAGSGNPSVPPVLASSCVPDDGGLAPVMQVLSMREAALTGHLASILSPQPARMGFIHLSDAKNL